MDDTHPIRAWRHRQEPPVRLRELADRIGTSTANLSRIENAGQPVSEDLLRPLCAATGLPAAILRPDLAVLFEVAG